MGDETSSELSHPAAPHGVLDSSPQSGAFHPAAAPSASGSTASSSADPDAQSLPANVATVENRPADPFPPATASQTDTTQPLQQRTTPTNNRSGSPVRTIREKKTHVAEPVLVQSQHLLDALRVATGDTATVEPYVLRMTTGGRQDSHDAYERTKKIADRAIVNTMALRAERALGADVENARAECRAYLRELVGSNVDTTRAYIVLASRSEQSSHTPLLHTEPCRADSVVAELEHQLGNAAQLRDGSVLMLYIQECIFNADAGLYECARGPEAAGPFVDDGCCQARCALVLTAMATRNADVADAARALIAREPLPPVTRTPVGYLRHSHALCMAYLSDAAYERLTMLVQGTKAAERHIHERPWCVVAWASLAMRATAELELSAYRALLCTDKGSVPSSSLAAQLDDIFGTSLAPLRQSLIQNGYPVTTIDEVATAVMRSLVRVDAATLNLPPMRHRDDAITLCGALYMDALTSLRQSTAGVYVHNCVERASRSAWTQLTPMGGPSRRFGARGLDIGAMTSQTKRTADDAYDVALNAAQMSATSDPPQAFGRPSIIHAVPSLYEAGSGARLLRAAIARCVVAVETKQATAKERGYVKDILAVAKKENRLEGVGDPRTAGASEHSALMTQLATG